MLEASDEEKKAEIAKRLEKAMENYTPRTKENPSNGRTRSRLEIRMGYEQKPCNPAQVLSEEIVPYVGHKTSVPYRLEPTIEYPDDMSVESDQKEILDSVADDPEYQQEMQLWRAYRDAYEEKARKNENTLRKRITSLEQQLVQLQDKYLPSTWSCEDPYVAKIEEQNKLIDKQNKLTDELKTDIGQLHKQIKEQKKTIYHLNKNPLLQLTNVEFDPSRTLAIEPMQAEPNHHE